MKANDTHKMFGKDDIQNVNAQNACKMRILTVHAGAGRVAVVGVGTVHT